MLSSTEMVMNAAGKMLPLEELIKSSGGSGITVISSIEDLPEPGLSTIDALYLLNTYVSGTSEFATLFDANGDTSKMLDGNVGTVIPVDIDWNDYYAVKITGAYKPTGEIWNVGAAVVEDLVSLLGKNFDIYDNTNHVQGKYTINAGGLYVLADTYGNCVIDKIEGKRKAIYPTILTTVKENNVYKWVDIINKKEVV